MDYSLGALKILCSHLTTATEATSHSQPAFSLGGILFQRAWLQGVLVSKPSPSNDAGRFLLDDGTGVIELKLSGDYLQNDVWELGMYVMVVGGYAVRKNGTSFIKVHKIVDLSPVPDREAMWYLEVVEAFRLFYQPLIEEYNSE
nr:recQ-mediated genome instability protein 2 isoform X2 [Ipomoea batatas]